jgi:predicted nucleic acid-binding protein
MIAYVDSSVLLRVALKQKNYLKEFANITLGGSSRLIKAECLRTLDRLVSTGQLNQAEFEFTVEFIHNAVDHLEIIGITEPILDRVGQPTGLNLGTLDAIHLYSAALWRLEKSSSPVFLTHDLALGKSAKLFGFEVLGM